MIISRQVVNHQKIMHPKVVAVVFVCFVALVDSSPYDLGQDGHYNPNHLPILVNDGLRDHDNIEFESRNKISSATNDGVPVIVEILVVVDKELADVFNQDEKKIYEYLDGYLRDINMRYMSLKLSTVSVKISSVLIMKDYDSQPFIEQARAEDGRVHLSRILNLFTPWLHKNRDNLPPFDIGTLMTNAKQEVCCGVAYRQSACGVGPAIWIDDGRYKTAEVAAHEIAHTLGASHDETDWCSGFIMGPSGGNNEKQHFFSDCTDSAIRDFLRLDGSNCLRTLEGNLTWPFGPAIPGSGWSGMEPIDVLPECKAIFNSNEAYLGEEVLSSCTTQCKVPIPGGTRFTYIPGIENGPCGNGEGRCFRGRCRNPTSTIHHKASNLCMTRSNRFTFQDNPVLMPCPRSIMVKTPLDGYLLTTTSDGIIFSSPYTYDNFNENSEKCLQSGPQGSILETARCELSSTSQLWEIRKSSPPCKVFDLIVNKATGLCLAPISNEIGSQIVHRPCDEGSNEILWWVEPGEDWGTGSFFANLPPMCSTG